MSQIGGGTGASIARWRALCAAGQMLCVSGEEVAEQATINLLNAATTYASLPAPPQVICLCGSTRHLAAFLDWQRVLTLHGVIVLTIGVVLRGKDDDAEKTGRELDELHRRKIDMADAVLVLDVDGYIGSSTKGEIAYAEETETTVISLSSNYPDYVSPNLEDVLSRTFSIEMECTYDENIHCHVGWPQLVR